MSRQFSVCYIFDNPCREEDPALQSPPNPGRGPLARPVWAARLLALGALRGPAAPPGGALLSPLSGWQSEGSRPDIWSDQGGLGGRAQWEKGKTTPPSPSPSTCPDAQSLNLSLVWIVSVVVYLLSLCLNHRLSWSWKELKNKLENFNKNLTAWM